MKNFNFVTSSSKDIKIKSEKEAEKREVWKCADIERKKEHKILLSLHRWRCGGSNPVPLACKASALPFELHPHLSILLSKINLIIKFWCYFTKLFSLEEKSRFAMYSKNIKIKTFTTHQNYL